ncbi:MAG: PAC2 family protein, partial [Thermoplasmata archaeon]
MASPFQWVDDPAAAGLTRGGVVLSCFPSAGLAATVAAHYMVQVLELPRVGVLDSEDSLPLAIIQRNRVQPPIRVYGKGGLALVLSEFPPTTSAARPIADAILDGAQRLGARLVLAVDGVVPHPTIEAAEAVAALPEEAVWAICAQDDPEITAQFQRARA